MSQTKNLYLVVPMFISSMIFELYDEFYELCGKTEIYINIAWNIDINDIILIQKMKICNKIWKFVFKNIKSNKFYIYIYIHIKF